MEEEKISDYIKELACIRSVWIRRVYLDLVKELNNAESSSKQKGSEEQDL